jgi:hypothetical protein
MRRRTLLWGSAAIAGTGLAGAALWKPGDLGGPHNQYFAGMNEILKSQGPGRPVMVLDLDRANSNIDTLTAGFESPRTYRIVVKSLPSVPLVTTHHAARRYPRADGFSSTFPECYR